MDVVDVVDVVVLSVSWRKCVYGEQGCFSLNWHCHLIQIKLGDLGAAGKYLIKA